MWGSLRREISALRELCSIPPSYSTLLFHSGTIATFLPVVVKTIQKNVAPFENINALKQIKNMHQFPISGSKNPKKLSNMEDQRLQRLIKTITILKQHLQ
jgi:hypothetical protein